MTTRYVLDKSIQVVFKDLGISLQDVLRHAQLPLDLMSRKQPTITAEEYYRLWHGLEIVTEYDPIAPLNFGQSISAEAFSPPIFAAFCSENLNMAANRISYYKPLVGPMRIDVTQNAQQTLIAFSGLPENAPIPFNVIAFELVFWVQLARLATRDHIVPMDVHTTVDIPEKSVYEDYFGTTIHKSTFNGVSFHARDAARPFLTANEQMWDMFEPQLNMRMQDLEQESSFRDRVRACLMEILASGQYSITDVAGKLAISSRTLQRRLAAEDTTFQKELDSLREQLARNYLKRSDYTSGQIAFLLGYEDPNSFFRAFRSWTGQTPEVVRAQVQL